MPPSAPTIEEMERRIAELESELIKTKLQAALAQSNEEHLRLESRRLHSTVEGHAPSLDGGDENSYASPQRSHQPTHPQTLGVFRVPLADPFGRGRRGSQSSTSSGAAARARLNPNSCASGLNFLAELAGFGTSDGSLASSIASAVSSRKKRRTVLNPASCASALDLMGLIGPAAVAPAELEGRAAALDGAPPGRGRPPASGGTGAGGNKNAEWDCIPYHEY